MIKLFISHAKADDHFVDWLTITLEKEELGLDIFVDHRSNLPGDEAQQMLEEARRCVIYIPVLSNESVDRPFFKAELKTALKNPQKIIPIRFNCDDDKIPPEIKAKASDIGIAQGIIWVDFSNKGEWNLKYQDLRKGIESKLIEWDMYLRDEFFYQDAEHIDLILRRSIPTPSEIKTMVDAYLRKESYQVYFFKNLKNLNWLKHLKASGFFDRNPKPIEVENQIGYYRIPRWSVLDYLEWCSRQTDESSNQEYGRQLMEIIRSVSKFRDENGQRVDNNITDWVFVKIIANLPDCFVDIEDVQLISQFCDSRWGNSLISGEIGNNLLPHLIKRGQKEKAAKLLDIATSIRWKVPRSTISLDTLRA